MKLLSTVLAAGLVAMTSLGANTIIPVTTSVSGNSGSQGVVQSLDGYATNLSVFGLTIDAATVTTPVVIETQVDAEVAGSDSAEYAGTYTFQYWDDVNFVNIFYDGAGHEMWDDASVGYGPYGSWVIGDWDTGTMVFYYTGDQWVDGVETPVDITVSAFPEYTTSGGDVTVLPTTVSGPMEVAGTLSGARLDIHNPSPDNSVTVRSLQGPDGTVSTTGNGLGLIMYNQSPSDSISVNAQMSLLHANSLNNGTLNLGGPSPGSLYWSMASLSSVGSPLSIGDKSGCSSIFAAIYAQSAIVDIQDVNFLVGAFGTGYGLSGANTITMSNCDFIIGTGGALTGPILLKNATNVLMCGSGITVSNKSNVAIVGNGITAFKSDAFYAGSFVAGSGNGTATTNNAFYFGSNSWLYVNGTNLMFRATNGVTRTVTLTP